ncbi:MAG: hypothetical protein H0V17_15250 [Deltaproteobacteria bacterium]|nr:hypothetical protein [Deltaproteobacteria bacterium]
MASRADDDDDGGGNASAIRFTQSIGGAMWVNPDAFPIIPVHVLVDGAPTEVTISLDGVEVEAVRDGEGPRYTAMIDVTALGDGTHELLAKSHGVSSTAVLAAGREGIQWTSIAVDKNAATPRLHKLGEQLFLTWTDISSGSRVAWIQQLDGAGRRIGDKSALVGGDGQEDKHYARTAAGASTMGVLYQERGGPYKNFFAIVGRDGSPTIEPIVLDPNDRFGSNSGDVVFTGTGYDLVWRTNSGAGSSDIRWMHVDEATGAITGPIIAASPGAGDPQAGFDAITNVTIRHHHGTSLIAFSRYVYDTELELELLRCQLASVTDGVATTALIGIGDPWVWDNDCRILDDGTGPVAVRSVKSLTSSDDNPPDELFATRVPLDSARGDGRMIVTAPETRVEPTMIGTTAAPIMAWSDARKYAIDITQGEVELYAAVLGPDLVATTHVGFPHSHFIEGSADIRGAAAGENAILTWIDERHGGSVLEPRPEVYLETVWQ